MALELWTGPEELLMLFSIDPSAPGADDFADLVWLSATVLKFPELGCGTYSVAVQMMRERKWSPLVYWSRIKRGCRPLIEAGAETLRGLGLLIPEGDKLTGYTIAHGAAAALAAAGLGGELGDAEAIAKRCERGREREN